MQFAKDIHVALFYKKEMVSMPTVEDLVKLFDLEIGEEFRIYSNLYKEQYNYVYKFSNDGLLYLVDDYWKPSFKNILGFFTGEYIIIKEPWKPKRFERYYCITVDGEIDYPEWEDDFSDLTFYAAGNCFKTYKEAEGHIMEIKERLQKIYDSGKPLISVAKEQDK